MKKMLLAMSAIAGLGAAPVLAANPDLVYLPPIGNPVIANTKPVNGDVNPYGVAFIPAGFPAGGLLVSTDILVSNFNNKANLQGTGTTIIQVNPKGLKKVFFASTPPVQGLSTALNVLRAGYIIVGEFPSTDGTCGTASAGSLLVIDNAGHLVQTITDPKIDGPWDMAVADNGTFASLFISNGLNGTISRIDVKVAPLGTANPITKTASSIIGSAYRFQCDPVTFVDAPTGLAYDQATDELYVASTVDNAIFKLSEAGHRITTQFTGTVVYDDNQHLHGPLALAFAPNGHLLTSSNDAINADPNHPSEIVEFTTGGEFVAQFPIDPNLGGSFGLAVQTTGHLTSRFAAVDDNTSQLKIWTVTLSPF
jgi:hypothetical protein